MGKAIPTQHPAVVLRSHYKQLRALLAVAMIAVVGLTAAVVILVNDSDEVSSTSSAAKPTGSINYGDSKYVNPSTGYPTAPLPQREASVQNRTGDSRYDGGPEEGTRGAVPARQPGVRYDGGPEEGTADVSASGTADVSASQPRVTQSQAFPGLASEATGAQADERRYDGGPEEGTRGSGH
jgi:hypothetical protein